MKLGDKLRRFRKENNYTQQQIAEKLYVTAQAVSKWENNKSAPDISTLVQISDLYNVSLDDLIKADKQFQDRLSIKNPRLKVIISLVLAFISVITLFTSLLIKGNYFLYQHSIGGWLVVGCIYLLITFTFLSLYFYIIVGKRYFIFIWSAILMLSFITLIGMFYEYIIELFLS